MSVFQSELTEEFQEALLQVALQDSSFLNQYRDCLDASYFQNPDFCQIAEIALSHHDKFGVSINHKVMTQVLEDEKKRDDLADAVDTAWSAPILDASYIKERIVDFAKKRAIIESLFDVEELTKAGQYGEAESLFLKAAHVGDGRPIYDEYFSTIEKRVEAYRQGDAEKIPTGIEFVDAHTGGGLSRGELGVIMADTGIGKTHILVNFAKYAVLNGYRCSYYTLEVSSRIIARRMDMSITGLNKQELKRKPKTAIKLLIEASKSITEDRFFIHHYNRLTVSQLEAHLRLLQDKDSFFPDLLIVDYGDLMDSGQQFKERRHELSSIFTGLRAIGDMNIAVWTATQSNREGAKILSDQVIDKIHAGEDYGKMTIADVVVTGNQTLGEKRAGLMRLFMAKNRDDKDGMTGTINVDWTRSQITDVIDEEE